MIGPRSCRRRLDALHHLEKARKRYLFRRLAERLEFGGAILVADIIATSSQFARPSFESQWDELARQQFHAWDGLAQWVRESDQRGLASNMADGEGRERDALPRLRAAQMAGASGLFDGGLLLAASGACDIRRISLAMPSTTVSRVMSAPREQAWAVLSDVANARRWNSAWAELEFVSGQTHGPGTKFRARTSEGESYEFVVSAWVSPEYIEFTPVRDETERYSITLDSQAFR